MHSVTRSVNLVIGSGLSKRDSFLITTKTYWGHVVKGAFTEKAVNTSKRVLVAAERVIYVLSNSPLSIEGTLVQKEKSLQGIADHSKGHVLAREGRSRFIVIL